MQSLLEYFASAPKTHLMKLYRRDHPDAGLLQATQIVDEVRKRTLDPKRLQAAIKDLDSEARRLLMAIYAAEERGVLESELVRGSGGGPAWTGYWLGVLEYELLILCREGEGGRSYHGFREMAPLFLPTLLAEFAAVEETPSSTGWISNAPYATAHLCHFLGRVALGELRLTQAGELHRKSLQELSKGFVSGESLSATAAEEEATFLFRFAADAGLLLEEEGVLQLSSSAAAWMEEGRSEIAEKLREWWLRKRIHGGVRVLKGLSEHKRSNGASAAYAYAILTLIPVFSVYEGWDKARVKAQNELFTWENLPRPLRELWLLGGVEFAMQKGRIRWARILPVDRDAEPDASSGESPRGLPNLEALVPVGGPLNRQFQIELVANRDNDEMLTRYRFTKDSVVEGLRAGMTAEGLQELAAWLGFEAPARRTFADWAASYVSAVFREIFVLHVRDAERFRELEEFPQFMDLVTEVIPGYGFVLPKMNREAAREYLRVFDLLPGDEYAVERTGRPVLPNSDDTEWFLPSFAHGEIAYRHVAPAKREPPPRLDPDRGPKVRAEETAEQRLRMVEDAMVSERMIEFAHNGAGKRMKVQPLHLLRNRDPMKLIAVELGSGHRNEYLLDQMLNMRVVDEAG